MKKIAAVILAAGSSVRFGSPKQIAIVGGEMLLSRAVRIAREAGCSPIVVVLGAAAGRIVAECALGGAVIVCNQGWAEGMGSSVRAGIGTLDGEPWGEVEGCVVMTCDMPIVSAAHLRTLSVSGEMTASLYAGRRGVPAYFPSALFADLLALTGDEGARELLRSAPSVELAGGEVDVDTQEDLELARELFGAD